MSTAEPRQIDTDVLVIDGGMTGAFAALTAQGQGLAVTLVDKGTVGRSGATPWANGFSVFDEAEGHDRDEWIAGVRYPHRRRAQFPNQRCDNTAWSDVVVEDSRIDSKNQR